MRAILAASVVLTLCFPARADEPDKDLARTRFRAGQALFQRGRTAEALAEFEDGKKSFAMPEFDYNIGLCLAKLGRPGEAADALQRYIDARPEDPDATGIWKMIAEERAQAVQQQEAARLRKEEAERAPQLVPLPSLAPVAAPPRNDTVTRRRALHTKLGIASATIGGALVLAAALTGGAALSSLDDYNLSCDRGHCSDPDYRKAQGLANATDVMLTVGVALVVTSIALFATRPKLAKQLVWRVSF